MPLDTDAVRHTLSARATLPTSQELAGAVGAPHGELARGPAASLVAEHAARSGLFLYHFEHRAHLPLADDWLPDGQPELGDPPVWQRGVLPEPKYQSFLHDLPLGSFHPGHRAKWATHELCHGLVGSAWRADATPFFLATAGRLAELLPVVLWYTLDEAHLRRCAAHQGGGALFRTLCADCERLAAPLVDDPDAERHIEEARRYLDRELAAVARSRRLGRPVPFQFATLDLCSDGVAYAAAHARRLQSDAFAILHAGFCVPGGPVHDSLDALEARVLEVAGLFEGKALRPWSPSPAHGRLRWTLHDLAWRLLTVWSDTEGDASDALLGIVDGLAAAVPATSDPQADVQTTVAAAIQEALESYTTLEEEVYLPEPAAVFGVGYDLPGIAAARSAGQLAAGLASGLPETSRALGEGLIEVCTAFAPVDPAVRVPLSQRFSDWLAGDLGSAHPLAEVARLEAAMCSAPAPDLGLGALGVGASGEHRLAAHARLLRLAHDAVDLVDGLSEGDLHFDGETLVFGDGTAVGERPTALLVGRPGGGDVVVHPLGDATAAALSKEATLLDTPALQRLAQDGWLLPTHLTETWA